MLELVAVSWAAPLLAVISGTEERMRERLVSCWQCWNIRSIEVKARPAVSRVRALMLTAKLRTKQFSREEVLSVSCGST
jgi:predicted nucleotidyltransferase